MIAGDVGKGLGELEAIGHENVTGKLASDHSGADNAG